MNKVANSQFFDDLIAKHQGILWKVARTYCSNEIDRQDLVQEMMLQLWKALPSYQPAFALSTWLYRVVLNVAISFYRKNSSQKNNSLPLHETMLISTENEGAAQEANLNLLEQFINELNDLDKALILLYLEDKSHAEIASILGISLTNVATKISRIKERLRKKFKNIT